MNEISQMNNQKVSFFDCLPEVWTQDAANHAETLGKVALDRGGGQSLARARRDVESVGLVVGYPERPQADLPEKRVVGLVW